jgi:enolase
VLSVPLSEYFGGANAKVLPVPMMNILNGGAHSDVFVDIQEFMIMSHNAPSIRKVIRMGAETFLSLKKILKDFGRLLPLEMKGVLLQMSHPMNMPWKLSCKPLKRAGYRPGDDISIALDIVASGRDIGSKQMTMTRLEQIQNF